MNIKKSKLPTNAFHGFPQYFTILFHIKRRMRLHSALSLNQYILHTILKQNTDSTRTNNVNSKNTNKNMPGNTYDSTGQLAVSHIKFSAGI